MTFLKDIPNYKSLHSDQYYMSKVPDTIWQTLESYATKAGYETSLTYVINKLNDIVLIPHTKNWGESYLKQDLSDTITYIKKYTNNGKFDKFMDTISTIVEIGSFDITEINSFLEEYMIGYELNSGVRSYFWTIRENITDLTKEIEVTKEIVKITSQQAYEQLADAKKHLITTANKRDLKNALWNCICAMENIIKICAENNKDIKDATNVLRNSKKWGNDDIVKDGLSIFNRMHTLYPDLRHGSSDPKPSDISLNEAKYWIERITAHINYMIKQSEDIGKKI